MVVGDYLITNHNSFFVIDVILEFPDSPESIFYKSSNSKFKCLGSPGLPSLHFIPNYYPCHGMNVVSFCSLIYPTYCINPIPSNNANRHGYFYVFYIYMFVKSFSCILKIFSYSVKNCFPRVGFIILTHSM